MTKKRSPEKYAARMISKHLKRVSREVNGAYEARDPEHVHQARVASRRLRNSFWAFREALPPVERALWKKQIKNMADAMGRARDLDTQILFLEKFAKKVKKKEYRASIDRLAAHLREKRKRAQPRVKKTLAELKRKKTLEKIAKKMDALSKTPPSRSGKTDLYELAEKKIRKRLKKLLACEEHAGHPERSRELHMMRIAAKKFRYTMENFQPLYGKKIDPFIDAAHAVQDNLGRVHDLDVWIDHFRKLQGGKRKDGDLARASAYFVKLCSRTRRQAYLKFVKHWRTLRKKNKWKKLKALIT